MKKVKLIKHYKSGKKAIAIRIKEFKNKNNSDDKDIFKELCFCILTPQSKAKVCWAAIEKLSQDNILYAGNFFEIRNKLYGVRFKNNKARYILAARNFFKKNQKLDIKSVIKNFGKDYTTLRDFLVKNIKGYGYKEASHFLRNIGLGGSFAILDRHILNNLVRCSVLEKYPKSLSRKLYLDIEDKMKAFSKKIKIPMEELDLLFWSQETGEIFK